MTPSRKFRVLSRSPVLGTILGVTVVAPALAAPSVASPSLPLDATAVPAHACDLLPWGSAALLIAAPAAKTFRERDRSEPPQQGPDLRWWKNPPGDP